MKTEKTLLWYKDKVTVDIPGKACYFNQAFKIVRTDRYLSKMNENRKNSAMV